MFTYWYQIDEPTVVYSLTNPVGSKLFNFNKLVCNLDAKAFLQENTGHSKRDAINGNVAFICQRFYATVLIKEIDLNYNNTGKNKT